MHLKAEALAAIEPLDEDGKGAVGGPAGAHDIGGVPREEGAQGLAGMRAGRDHGLGLGAVDDFPALADGGAGGEAAAEGRRTARPAHLARLRALADAGRLLLAGPCPAIDAEDPGEAGFSGSLVVAEFASLEEARAWAAVDPYVDAGVYARVEVRPFRRVLP